MKAVKNRAFLSEHHSNLKTPNKHPIVFQGSTLVNIFSAITEMDLSFQTQSLIIFVAKAECDCSENVSILKTCWSHLVSLTTYQSILSSWVRLSDFKFLLREIWQ